MRREAVGRKSNLARRRVKRGALLAHRKGDNWLGSRWKRAAPSNGGYMGFANQKLPERFPPMSAIKPVGHWAEPSPGPLPARPQSPTPKSDPKVLP